MIRLILLLATLAACTTHLPGLREQELQVGESSVSYQLLTPVSLRRPAPVVVALHRFTEDGALMAKLTGLNEVAEREGFVVVYPNGPGRRFEAWENEDRDDVALVLAILEDLNGRMRIDHRRIYVTGASNGGFLTHRLACLEPRVFAAAAPVMSLMPKELATRVPDGAPVPMLMIHGTKDWIVPETAMSVFAGSRYEVLPMDETVDYWVRRNNSDPKAVTTQLPDLDPEDKTCVVLHRHPAKPGGAETRYYRVLGGGHTWPGGTERAPTFIVGRTSRDFSATKAIWEFFARHRLPLAALAR